jgi:MFS family permease
MSETETPLRRNRAYLTLQLGRWTSNLGTQLSTFAYPLVVLVNTGSAIGSGIVVAAKLVPYAFLGPTAGAVADRFDRRRIMLAADAARFLVLGVATALVATGRVHTWQLAVAALAEGTAAVFFTAAHAGLVRAIVPKSQLRAAAATDAARAATVRLAGPVLGGVLMAVSRALPFAADAASCAVSFFTLSRLRKAITVRPPRGGEEEGLWSSVTAGWTYLRDEKVTLACTLILSLGSFAIPGIELLFMLCGRRAGLSVPLLGQLLAGIGIAALLGAAAAGRLTKVMSLRAVILLELWVSVTGLLFLIWPSPWLLLPAILLQAFFAPVTDAAVAAYVMGNVPDEFLGRVTSTTMALASLMAPLGPIAAGVLAGLGSPRVAMAFFIAMGVALAVWATSIRSLRTAAWTATESEA